MKLLSRVQLFATPWTIAYQTLLSMGFSRQEYWNALPFPSPGDIPNPGIEPESPALQADALTSELPGKHLYKTRIQKDIHTCMLTAALFTVPQTWRPERPLTGEWMEMWYTHTLEYYLAVCVCVSDSVMSDSL